MPLNVQMTTLETPPSGNINEEMVDHPLSPTQEADNFTIVKSHNNLNFQSIFLHSIIRSIFVFFFCSIQNFRQAVIV